MQDVSPRVLSRPSFSYAIEEGQPCFDGCEGHFTYHPNGECKCDNGRREPCGACLDAYLACDVCELDATTVEAIVATALRDYQDKRGLEDALREANEFKSQHAALHRAIARSDGFKPGRRAFEQDIVPGNGDAS